MSKRKTSYQDLHPGYDDGDSFGGRQPRIDTAEKQQAAQHPRPFESEKDKCEHPGYQNK